MPTIPTLLTFAIAATLLVVVPGPNLMYIVTRGIDQGRRAAVVSALGVETGTLVHVLLATIGLSAVIASSEVLFTIIRFAGAGYLIWLGIANIRSRPTDLTLDPGLPRMNLRRIYAQGVIVNVLNPKVAIFFLAFLPQFVDRDRGGAALQILVLGIVLVMIGVASDLVYAAASGQIGSWLNARPAVARQRQQFSGAVYMLLGTVAAFSGSTSAKNR